MKVMDIFDFDENGKERYVRTDYQIGKDEYGGKNYEISYLSCRNSHKKMGMILGFDNPNFGLNGKVVNEGRVYKRGK